MSPAKRVSFKEVWLRYATLPPGDLSVMYSEVFIAVRLAPQWPCCTVCLEPHATS